MPTAENPADLPSRGVSLDQLKESQLRCNGPAFLRADQASWPAMSQPKMEPAADILLATDHGSGKPEPVINSAKYSSWLKLLRVTAWVQRFIACMKSGRKTGELSMKEIQAAKMYWMKVCQSEAASALQKGTKTDVAQQLGLFLDRHGLIRCSGKLDRSDLPYETRHPIYLSRKDSPDVCDLIVEDVHESIAHGGVEHTVSELRQIYWIPKCKSSVRQILRRCRT